ARLDAGAEREFHVRHAGGRPTCSVSSMPLRRALVSADRRLQERARRHGVRDGRRVNPRRCRSHAETRSRLYGIIDRMHGIDAVILGGTELPLLLTEREHDGVVLLDTTRIHVERILRYMASLDTSAVRCTTLPSPPAGGGLPA